jgi:inorganic phosphate transporter, PiT family
MIWLFLSGGLFLGWSLGANDAANVFGSAIGSGMVKFKKAAIICSLFIIAGAVIQGSGGAETLNSLGTAGSMKDAFLLTLSAAITVFGMSALGLPVSTSQAIVGAIIGWNLFSGVPTDPAVLRKILLTWVLCPLLAALFAMPLFLLMRLWMKHSRMHLLKQDILLRWGLIFIGAFGSYSLGANNIANVMGVFLPGANLSDISIAGIQFTGAQQLFFIGSLAIAIGVFTFSAKTMKTVGGKLFKLTPESALIVVFAHSLVLFVFSSSTLSNFVSGLGLPPIPLVPVSSSQAIVGAIIGIGLMRGGYGINFRVLGEIGLGWVITPVVSGILAYLLLLI